MNEDVELTFIEEVVEVKTNTETNIQEPKINENNPEITFEITEKSPKLDKVQDPNGIQISPKPSEASVDESPSITERQTSDSFEIAPNMRERKKPSERKVSFLPQPTRKVSNTEKRSFDQSVRGKAGEREYTGIFAMFNPETFKSTQSELDEDELMLQLKGQKELKIEEAETSGKYSFNKLTLEIIILNLKKDKCWLPLEFF
jgi:hypothetical protein